MVEIQPRGKAFSLNFTDSESERLGLAKGREYELTKAQDRMWILIEAGKTGEDADGKERENPKKEIAIDELEQKIIGMLRQLPLKERVEGWFEKKLNEAEIKKFKEMIAQKKVWVFKLNATYKKGVYKTEDAAVAAQDAPAKNFENKEKPIEQYTIENDGFVVVKNELRAKALSAELGEKIKAGEIRGIRSFSGEFFIIRVPLLITSQEKVLLALRGAKSAELSALSEKTGFTPTLVRIAMEFLKEEGQVIEKRKGFYQYIE